MSLGPVWSTQGVPGQPVWTRLSQQQQKQNKTKQTNKQKNPKHKHSENYQCCSRHLEYPGWMAEPDLLVAWVGEDNEVFEFCGSAVDFMLLSYCSAAGRGEPVG